MFEAVIVTGNAEPLEMNMSGSRVTVKWTKETGFTVTLVSKDTETRFNSKFDMIRVESCNLYRDWETDRKSTL